MTPPTVDPRTAHRPQEIAALALEARRLHASGLTVRDLGTLLGIGERAAAALLRLEARPEASRVPVGRLVRG